jgi:hypothetical protein
MGRQVLKTVNPVASLVAYAAGDNLGGILQIPGAVGRNRYGRVKTIQVKDRDSVDANLIIMLFSALPSGGTYTDNAALALGAADDENCLAVLDVPTANYVVGVGNFDIAKISPDHPIYCPSSGSLWMLIKTVATPTYTSTTALSVILDIEQNG